MDQRKRRRYRRGRNPVLLRTEPKYPPSLTLTRKGKDQQHRDANRMADHFVSVEALQPRHVKAWTDKLVTDGASAATMERIMNGCRNLGHEKQTLTYGLYSTRSSQKDKLKAISKVTYAESLDKP